MEAEEDDALKEHQPPSSPLPMTVADSCRQQVACEGGVGGGGELATVLGSVEGVVRDESGSGGGGNSDFAVENSGVVEVAGGVDGREGADGDVEGEVGGVSVGSDTADVAVGVWGVAGAVGDEAAVRDSYVVVTEEGVDNEGGFDRDNEIEVEEDKMAVDVVGICDGAAEKAEFIENADIGEADGLADVATVVEEEGIEMEGGYENESGIEMKEDVVEGGEFQGRVVGNCDEVTEKGKLRESAYTEEANVVVADVAEREEDVGVGGNREELIKDGGIDNKVVAESQEDVVADNVDDSGVSKEEVIVAMAVKGDGAALVMEDKDEVDIGSRDVGMDQEVVEVNESKKVGVSEFFPNLEFTSGVIALSMEKTEIAASKGEISLAENEEVTGGDRESADVVGMVNEIATSGDDIDGMDVGIDAGVNGAAETDEREPMDPTTIGEEKEQDAAAARVVGKLSDDATIETDETNGMSNMDSTEDADRKKVGDVGAEIDVEADVMEQDDAIAGVVGELSDDATIEADETNGIANVDSTEDADRKEVGDVGAEIDVEADIMEQDDAIAGVVGELSDDATIEADETNAMANVDSTEGADRKEVGDVAAEIDEMERDDASTGVVGELSDDVTIKADATNVMANVGADRKEVGDVGAEIDVEVDEKNGDDVTAGVLGMLSDNATIEAHETNRMARVDSTEDADGEKAGNAGTEIDVEADDVEEDNVLEDKEMDDFVEESQVTEYGDRPEETDVTEDTDMAEEDMEKVEQRKINVVLNRKGGKKGGRTSTKKKLEEDVCFICFDGGDLVLCDRRGCPKVYHPSCVNRDEAFFQTKGQWNCGWHLCSSCKKNPHYFCYTCTFSLCKGCIKDGIINVVRGNKGFCDICMRTVRMIESVIQGDNAMDQVDFDDKTSWEYLFKDYYMDLKEKLSISAEEIEGAKNPWKGADSGKQEFQDDAYDDEVGSDDSAGQSEVSIPKKRKASKRIKSRAKERKLPRRSNRANVTDVSRTDGVEWATKELLDFVMHMKDGDRSVLSQFDVQALLLEYIKSNQLRDPRRKSQIICDSRLQSLFGKPRVGHFEMLKLLESHFFLKDDTGDLQGSVVDVDASQADADHEADISLKARKQKKRKPRKRGDDRVLQSNIDDYAAIDVHNITLIYLRRSLVEDLLEDTETFDDKAIGSFVRIRIPGNNPKQEMYRLVPIIGTSKVAKPYKVGKKHTHYVLEIQNLGKPETIQIDIISNQEFTQDECLRLRQSIKYGVTNRLTVGDIQDKAIALQEVRVKDWLDAEIVRLSHLRDRASEKGHAKELRECVEKLQLLKTPQERQRRLNEVPEIHTDPRMDPNNESDDDEDTSTRGRSNASGRKSREPILPSKGVSSLNDSWSGIRTHSFGNRELTRSMSSKGYESWSDDGIRAVGDGVNQNAYMQARERDLSSEIGAGSTNARLKMESSSKAAPETPVVSLAANTLESVDKVNESKKMWHYKDPSGKIQGPFSIVQLRKWNSTGYFPVDLRIWRASETPDDSILLSDALKEKFLRDRPKTSLTAPAVPSQYALPLYATNQSTVSHESEPISVNKVPPSVEVPKFSTSRWSSGTNLPSPTPHQTPPSTIKGPKDEVKWSSATAKASSSVVAQSSTPSLVNTGGITGADVLHNVSSVLSQDPNMLMNAASALMAQSQSALPGQQRLTMETHVQNSQASDMKNPGSTIQNLVQAVQSHNPAANLQGWGSAAAPPETSGSAPSQRSGQWGEPPMQNPAFYGTGSSAGAFSNHWRPNSVDQSNFQSAAVPSANWGVNNSTNVFAAVAATNSQSQPNPNHNWMQAPANTGWAGSAPGNANMNWSGNANAGMPAQGRPQGGGPVPGWNAPPSQGAFGNTANPGMVAPAQAPLIQNSSFGSSGPGNRGGWMGEKNHNDGRYRGGGDSGYGGGRPWNRQSSFGAGGGGRDQGVCWFQDEYGNCRRGASCKFKHAGGSSGNSG